MSKSELQEGLTISDEDAIASELAYQQHQEAEVLEVNRSMWAGNPLFYLQQNLSAPKGQLNKFAGYNFRSAEDILEALKPLLKNCNCTLLITDEMICVGDRVYVKATVTLRNETGRIIAENSASAREAYQKTGMDESQITGAASSYARKYSLNGMLLIDDNKDADTNEHHKVNESAKPRVAHNIHINTCMNAMTKSKDIETLNFLSRSSYDYFAKFEQASMMKKITEHNAVCAVKFNPVKKKDDK
jgi:hypothetical protein